MVTSEEITHCLTTEWDMYLEEFEQKTDAEKQAFLVRQGYPRLAELLAHFTAWWQVGMDVIRHHQADPDYQHPAMDVDAFNQAVIAKVSVVSDADVRAEFETVRTELLGFVCALSGADLANSRINRQLQIEVIEHLREHQ